MTQPEGIAARFQDKFETVQVRESIFKKSSQTVKMDTVKSQLVMLSQNSQGVVNYVPWRLKLDAVLRTKKLYDVATGIKVKPEGAEDVAAVVAWNEKDMEALQLIVLNVSDQIAYKIANCKTARAMLDRLVCLYGTKTEINMEILRQKLFTCTYDESKSVAENCMEIMSIGDELTNGGEPVPESWTVDDPNLEDVASETRTFSNVVG